MNQRSFSAVLLFGLVATGAHAQAPAQPAAPRHSPATEASRVEPAPVPVAPAPVPVAPAPVAPAPAPPVVAPAPAPPAVATPAGAAPAVAPAVTTPAGAKPVEATGDAPAGAAAAGTRRATSGTTPRQTVAPLPPPGTVYVAPPYPEGYVAPPITPARPQVRFASPRLYPIERRAEPRKPRRYGNAGAPLAFGIGGGVIYRDDIGYELLSKSKGSAGFELFASYDIWAPSSLFVLSAGLDFRSELHDGAEDISVAHYTTQAELTGRLLATRWLWPHLRIAAGVVNTGFDVQDERGKIDYEDRDVGFAGTLGAGFTLRTPARVFETHNGRLSSLSLGLQLEGGYTLASAASLRAKPTGSSEIERLTFPAGKLDRAGPYFRVMFVVRF